jgi:predicted HAD superfamily hydrolase
MATHTIRKNFTMLEEIAKKLELLSEMMNKKQSQVIQELILQESRKYENSKKLERLEKMRGKLDGLLEDVSVQKIKSQDV